MATLPGWKEQLETEGAQAWTITYSTKEFTFQSSMNTYGDADEEEESEDEEASEEEKKEEVAAPK